MIGFGILGKRTLPSISTFIKRREPFEYVCIFMYIYIDIHRWRHAEYMYIHTYVNNSECPCAACASVTIFYRFSQLTDSFSAMIETSFRACYESLVLAKHTFDSFIGSA